MNFIFHFIILAFFSCKLICESVKIANDNGFCSKDLKRTDLEEPCSKSCLEFDPSGPSVIVKDSSGRLGNQMFNYLTLLAIKLRYNTTVYLSKKSYNMLSKYFKDIKILPAEDQLCGFEEVLKNFSASMRQRKLEKTESMMQAIIGKDVNLSRDELGRVIVPPEIMAKHAEEIEKVVHKPEFDEVETPEVLQNTSYPWQIYNSTVGGLKNESIGVDLTQGKAILLIHPSPTDLQFVQETLGLEEALDEDLKFHPKYLTSAEETLKTVLEEHKKSLEVKLKKKKKMKKAKTNFNNFTLVGIHSRRTDHLSLDGARGIKPLKPSYFLEAMDLYRESYENVLFLYISDDQEWGIKNLRSRTTSAGDLYFVGDGVANNQDSIGHDLALLSLCNHTIISHGTFSFWGGFLAGGKVITPFHFSNLRPTDKPIYGYKGHPLKKPLKRLHYQ